MSPLTLSSSLFYDLVLLNPNGLEFYLMGYWPSGAGYDPFSSFRLTPFPISGVLLLSDGIHYSQLNGTKPI